MSTETVKLTAYFTAVDRRLYSQVREFIEMHVQICGHNLLFHFDSAEEAAKAKLSFTGLIIDAVDQSAYEAV